MTKPQLNRYDLKGVAEKLMALGQYRVEVERGDKSLVKTPQFNFMVGALELAVEGH